MTSPRRQSFDEILRLARRQHHLVRRDQLVERGYTRSAIAHLIRSHRLFAVYSGVYAVGRRDLRREGRWLAAVFACGPDALLSRVPAGLLRGLLERGNELPHVTVPLRSHRVGPRGVTVHRAVELRREVVSGIPVTSVVDTLIDLAGELERPALKAAVRRAVANGLDLRQLSKAIALPVNDHRRARLREIVHLWVPNIELTQSELEARFFELCFRNGFPIPELQRPFGPYRSDFVWEDVKLVVETDGRQHLTPAARQADAARDRAFAAAGYVVLRFVWAEVVHQSADVARDVAGQLASRAR